MAFLAILHSYPGFQETPAFPAFFKGKIVCILYTKWAEIWQKSAVEWGEIGKSKQKQNGGKIQIFIKTLKIFEFSCLNQFWRENSNIYNPLQTSQSDRFQQIGVNMRDHWPRKKRWKEKR